MSKEQELQPQLIEAGGQAKVPKFDERCYSSGPNPYLEEWVRENATPYDPKKDKYDVSDFTEQVPATKATAIYNMHSYHAGKKPHDFIRHYIRHYTKPGDIVLDPMCGSGSAALAALMEGRKAIAIDISPAATFIAKNYCCPVDPVAVQAAFEEVKRQVKPEMDWLYETRCSRCGGRATTAYTVYSQVFKCPKCWEAVPLYDCKSSVEETEDGKEKKLTRCPHCGDSISTRSSEKTGAIPVAVSVTCLEKMSTECKKTSSEFRRHNDPDPGKRRYFEEYDLAKIREIETRSIPHWYPTDKMMHAPEDQLRWGAEWRKGRNFRTVDELFTKRNLWALATILDAIRRQSSIADPMLFAFTGVILGLSRMNRHRPEATFPPSPLSGTYYMPQVFQEGHALSQLSNKMIRLVRGYKEISAETKAPSFRISTQDATTLDGVAEASVDYVFTDPPYGDRIQYGELNFIWESWLAFNTHWHDREIIVNTVRGTCADDWKSMMTAVIRECYRILKPGRALSLCYHDTSEGTWAMLQDIMSDAGFIPEHTKAALVIDTGSNSYNQIVADSVLKRDLVLNFRKPMPGQRPLPFTIRIGGANINEKVQEGIRLVLSTYPGSPKDAVYDAVISMLVQDQQMAAHDFEKQLNAVAEPNDAGQWFLKNGENAEIPRSEMDNEAEAAKEIGKMIDRVEEEQDRIGAPYGDIFEFYVGQYHGRRPQRRLLDFLSDWFYPAPGGGYRNPETDEERQAKEMGRESGLNREIQRFLRHPGNYQAPDQKTLIEWLSHCLKAGLYEEGREFYERGVIDLSTLSPADEGVVEMNYRMCKSRLIRRAEQDQPQRPRRTTTRARTSGGQGTLEI